MSKLIDIQQSSAITEIHPDMMYDVRILRGAGEALVGCRELRGQYCKKRKEGYETNRDIKIWAAFFQLKAITTAPFIKNWRSQRRLLLTWLQMEERTLYWYLNELKKKDLITIDRNHNIYCVSWRQAAAILQIEYKGTTIIQFNPYKYEGKQTFQHFIRSEEIKSNKQLQLDALMNRLDKNQLINDSLMLFIMRQGADEQRLKKDPRYFQERLLQLQMQAFKEGSDIVGDLFVVRADINRGLKGLKKDHGYKSKQSVTYMKRIMARHRVITIKKIAPVISEARARFYFVEDEKQREGYKWYNKQKQTALILTDQISPNYETKNPGLLSKPNRQAA